MIPYIVTQINHPLYQTDESLADWLSQFEIFLDSSCENLLGWMTPASIAPKYSPDIIIEFLPDGRVEVNAVNRFKRTVSFLKAKSDDERMQQLLDLLINCCIKQDIVCIDLVDVFQVFYSSEHGVIDCVEDVKMLPGYVSRWKEDVAPLLGDCVITSLEFIYREYNSSLEDFNYTMNMADSLVDEEGLILFGILSTEKPEDKRNAVLYFGVSRAPKNCTL